MRIFLIFILSLPGTAWLFAQTSAPVDTLLLLPSATVTAPPLRADRLSAAREKWTTAALRDQPFTNLSDLLATESGAYIKSYGLGSLATPAIRGGAAGHTAVLWNGLPLSSPMLGLLDLSLLPLFFQDEVSLEYGGQSANWGSGAISGAILLNNERPTASSWELGAHTLAGSFGRFDQGLSVTYGRQRWHSRTRLLYRWAENNFPYQLRDDLPLQRQQNARLRQYGVQQEIYFQPNEHDLFTARVWYQDSDRQLPPTSVQNRSEAEQTDRSLRLALHWQRQQGDRHWQARAAHFRERILYRDPLILLTAPSEFTTTLVEGERQAEFGPWRWRLGVQGQYLTARSPNYETTIDQRRAAAFGALRYRHKTWRAELSLRAEGVDRRLLAPVPTLEMDWSPTDWLTLAGSVSRNYRLPTLNDRYWQPGGNPNLRPESGWSQELGSTLRWRRGDSHWQFRINGYTRRIRDWIIWTIRDSESFFSPNNLTEVTSRGGEIRLGYNYRGKSWSGGAKAGYDYTRAINRTAVATPRLAAGEQLAYVPRHQAFAMAYAGWQRWEVRYRHSYTGSVRGLNVATIDAYDLGELQLRYTQDWGERRLTSFCRLENLWNRSYRVIERRPMPGRAWQLGLQLTLSGPAVAPAPTN